MGRVMRTAAGVGLVLLGIVLLPLPGPGTLVIVAGLGVLGTEYLWARQLNHFVRHHFRKRLGRNVDAAEDQDGG